MAENSMAEAYLCDTYSPSSYRPDLSKIAPEETATYTDTDLHLYRDWNDTVDRLDLSLAYELAWSKNDVGVSQVDTERRPNNFAGYTPIGSDIHRSADPTSGSLIWWTDKDGVQHHFDTPQNSPHKHFSQNMWGSPYDNRMNGGLSRGDVANNYTYPGDINNVNLSHYKQYYDFPADHRPTPPPPSHTLVNYVLRIPSYQGDNYQSRYPDSGWNSSYYYRTGIDNRRFPTRQAHNRALIVAKAKAGQTWKVSCNVYNPNSTDTKIQLYIFGNKGYDDDYVRVSSDTFGERFTVKPSGPAGQYTGNGWTTVEQIATFQSYNTKYISVRIDNDTSGGGNSEKPIFITRRCIHRVNIGIGELLNGTKDQAVTPKAGGYSLNLIHQEIADYRDF